MTQSSSADPQPAADTSKQLADSARGWHTIQVGVLGFIGICGVLRSAASAAPTLVQWLAVALAVAALAIACLAVLIVGRVAYPIDTVDNDSVTQHTLVQARGRLNSGIRLTILALILIVTAALTGWWPHHPDTTLVTVSANTGQSWCGPLTSGPANTISVRTAQGVIAIPTQLITQLSPVPNCP